MSFITLPNNTTTGFLRDGTDYAKGSYVYANDLAITNVVNGALDNSNLSPSANIASSKISSTLTNKILITPTLDTTVSGDTVFTGDLTFSGDVEFSSSVTFNSSSFPNGLIISGDTQTETSITQNLTGLDSSDGVETNIIRERGDSTAGETNDNLYRLRAYGNDSTGTQVNYTRIRHLIGSPSSGGYGSILVDVARAGSLEKVLEMSGNARTVQCGSNYNFGVQSGQHIALDGNGDTYAYSPSSNIYRIMAGGEIGLEIDHGDEIITVGSLFDLFLQGGQKLLLNGTDNYFVSSASGEIKCIAGGTQIFETTSSSLVMSNGAYIFSDVADFTSSASRDANSYQWIRNDGNAYIEFTTPSTDQAGFLFSDTTGAVGQLLYSHSSDNFSMNKELNLPVEDPPTGDYYSRHNHVKTWVRFTSDNDGTNISITNSHNISSVTLIRNDTNSGNEFRINFDRAMADVLYAVNVTCRGAYDTDRFRCALGCYSSLATTRVDVIVLPVNDDDNGNLNDELTSYGTMDVTVTVFGELS